MTTTVNYRLKMRGRLAADWTSGNEVLLAREIGIETDTRKFKFGDGTTAWNSLPYVGTAYASGVQTFLETPTSANLRAAVTDETGTGSLVFATSPTLVTPALGTPSAVVLTNGTGLPTSGLVDDAVTYAKMQNVSATDKLLGRSTAGAGDVEEIACTPVARTLLAQVTQALMRTVGLGLGTAATQNTGTSGANVPLMNASNTWSALQIFDLIRIAATNPQIALLDTDTSGINALGSFILRDSSNTVRYQIGKPFAGGEVYFDNTDDGFRFSKGASGHVFIDTASKRFDLISGYVIRINSQQVVGARGAALPADATDLASAITLVNAIKARLKTTGGHGLVAD